MKPGLRHRHGKDSLRRTILDDPHDHFVRAGRVWADRNGPAVPASRDFGHPGDGSEDLVRPRLPRKRVT